MTTRQVRPSCYVFVTAILVLWWIFARPGLGTGTASPSKQERMREIEDKLSSEKRKLEAFGSEEKGLLEQLADLEREVEEKRRAVEGLKTRIQGAGAESAKLEDQLKSLDLKSKGLEDRIGERVVNLYKYARRGYLRTLASADSVDEVRQRVKYVRAVMKEDQKILRAFADEELKCRNEMADVKRRISEIETSRGEEQKALARLRQDLEQKVLRLMNVHKEKEFYETAVRELESAASDFRSTLKQIEDRSVSQVQGEKRFEDYRGKLPVPLTGKIVRGSDFGGSSGLALHKGIFIEGSTRGEVRAVFPGRVDFSGRLKGYGEVVIVNHGARYFTIAGLLTKRLKREGDLVSEGDVVGVIGGGDVSGDRRLYFEIRRGGENLDPEKWFSRR